MTPNRPHISAALVQLRVSVTLAMSVLAVCTFIQLLIFGFVHFTDARWEQIEPPRVEQAPAVVHAGRAATTLATAAPLRIPSRWDSIMREFSSVAASAGVLAAVALVAFVFAGLVVAGGASTPGVDHVVRAFTWSMVLAGISLPWINLSPRALVPGVFISYEALVAGSAAVTAGRGSGTSLVAAHLIAPLVTLGIAVFVAIRFRAGVEAGVIVTSVSEFDEAIERELQHVRQRGASASVTRTVGALNRAIGDGVSTAHAPHEHEPRPRTEPTRPRLSSDDPRRPL